jgi:addiction module HigA family antidote
MAERRLPPIHPGEILREEFMVPLNLSINRLSRDLRVPVNRVSEIVNGKRGITAGSALRLARYFNTTPQFWLNLQTAYELEVSGRAEAVAIRREVRPLLRQIPVLA